MESRRIRPAPYACLSLTIRYKARYHYARHRAPGVADKQAVEDGIKILGTDLALAWPESMALGGYGCSMPFAVFHAQS